MDLLPGLATTARRTLSRLEAIFERSRSADWWPAVTVPRDPGGETAVVEKRFTLLVLAGGSLSLAMIGLVWSGVPAGAWLLQTHRLLARSAPCLADRLRLTPISGP